MARNYVGLPLGGMIALWAILLWAPDTHGQAITAKKVKVIISGTVGLEGVTLQGFPVTPAPTTDQNGVYSVEVDYGWHGTVTPVKKGYTFAPGTKTYPRATANLSDENYTATLVTYTISGSVMQSGVKMVGFPEEVTSDASGRYTATVPAEWSGTVTPTKEAYQFEPEKKEYKLAARNLTDDYKAADQTFVISGTAGVEGVVLKGLANTVTGPGGAYRAVVKYGWSGKVTPAKEGHEFLPPEMDYPPVTANQTNQDYIAKVFSYPISGTAGLAGVIMKGLPGEPMTDGNGFYTATVTHGWLGKVTPDRPGYTFTPAFIDFPKVTAPKEGQDFTAKVIYYTISGSAGEAGVTMSGLPGDPVSNDKGIYTAQIEYNWSGTVTPTKEGFVFNPPSKEYSAVAQNQTQNYTAQGLKFKISGNVGGQAQVLLKLTPPAGPGSVVAGPEGSYSVDVPYGWKGIITPQKAGLTFDPNVRDYPQVLSPQPGQDYVARIMQYSLSGRILDETGNGVAGVTVAADNNGGSTTTSPTGQFDLKVNYGWRGRLTFQTEGYTLNPPSKTIDAVTTDIKNLTISAKIRMVTITDKITLGEGPGAEPIADVKITALPGGTTPVTTDNTGKYSIKVPYGWTGELKFQKEGFEFSPDTKPFTNVVQDIDNVTPKKPVPPPTQPPTTQPPTTQPPTTQPPTTQPPTTQPPTTQPPTTQPGPTFPPSGPTVPPNLIGMPNLHNVLTELAKRTGVSITWDGTVKADPVPIPLSSVENLPVAQAIHMIVTSIKPPYTLAIDDSGKAFKVYRSISNSFPGVDLLQALQDLSAATGVAIIPDPNVTGQVNVTFENASLDEALEMLLAGKPFVFKKMPLGYYLVAERGIYGRAFPEISETRRIRLNYTAAVRAKMLLSPVFAPYVQAEPSSTRDPNDQGNTLIVTAAPGMIDRIVEDIKKIDRYKRQVLLDARVVAMERGDLLNLGVEWGWPKIQAGLFTDRTADATTGLVNGGWPWGVQIGYTPDKTFTDSLLMALNLLQENSQADIIANPKVVAQDGRQAEMRVIQEEWFMMQSSQQNQFFYSNAQLQKIESGTVLTITPYIGDNNDIMLQMAVEVSDSIPKGRGSDLPIVTRRTARNAVTVKDGGTVAVGGLTENRSKTSEKRVPGLSSLPLVGKLLFTNKNNDKASREVAVFVTAHLVPEGTQVASKPLAPAAMAPGEPPAGDEFRPELEKVLASQNR